MDEVKALIFIVDCQNYVQSDEIIVFIVFIVRLSFFYGLFDFVRCEVQCRCLCDYCRVDSAGSFSKFFNVFLKVQLFIMASIEGFLVRFVVCLNVRQ